MRFLRRSLVGIFLVAVSFGLLAWAGDIFYTALQQRMADSAGGPPARERIFSANVVLVEAETIEPVLTTFGEIRSRRTLELRAPSSGTLVELADNFEEGASVALGQLLAKIDPSEAQSALDVAKTELQTAQDELRDADRNADLVQDELKAAEDQLALREQTLRRQQNLSDRGVGTEANVEDAQLAVASARQSVLAERQSVANAATRQDQAKTSLARAKIDLSEAERALRETEIFAGFTGTLSEVNAVQGGLVANNEKLGVIVDAQALEVAFRVSTPQYVRLLDETGGLIHNDVLVSLDIMGVDLATTGTITRESAEVGEGQTGRLLFARIDDPKGFRPGDFTTVQITEPPLRDVALLPSSAVDSNSTVLALGPDDRLQEIDVTVLRRQTNDVIVGADEISGKEIVSERSPLLGHGIRIRPIRAQDGTETAEAAAPEMIELEPERRAKIVAFIEANKNMPAEAKQRILGQLENEQVPAQVVARIESRMGG